MGTTLYVTDLDGTLLQSCERISDKSCKVINSLVERGMIFSYATARSVHTASKVTFGLNAKFPIIVYNGAFIVDNQTKKRILTNTFSTSESKKIFSILDENGISPLVYSLIDGKEKFSYNISKNLSKGMIDFLYSRKGDIRDNPLADDDRILDGSVFYFNCIDSDEKLYPIYNVLKKSYNCIYQEDIYFGAQMLEIMPKAATKANAILQLKKLYNCDKVVSFGDGVNDISMFKISDECYAVKNACEELKQIATAVIGSNDCDGVAEWLVRKFQQ